jgi:hypothetical protein
VPRYRFRRRMPCCAASIQQETQFLPLAFAR